MHGLDDLALALGGSPDSFTGQLLRLIVKAQASPENYAGLRRGFPRMVRAWELWMATGPYAPTGDELLDALDSEPVTPDTDPCHIVESTSIGPVLIHPDGCTLSNCPVLAAALWQAANPYGEMPDGSRWEIETNDLGDRVCVLDRVDGPEVADE